MELNRPEVIFVFGIFLICLRSYGKTACPPSCMCYRNFATVVCEGRHLSKIPPGIPERVEKLLLGYNRILSISRDELCTFPNLKEIRLQNNNITAIQSLTFDGICLPSLSKIKLENNKIDHIEANSFHNLTSLNSTYLQNNYINNIHPASFNGSSSLTLLHLGQNHLIEIPSFLFLRKLQNLFLEGNRIKDALFSKEYNNMSSLKNIGLSNNHIKQLQDKTFQNLGTVKSLRKLEIARNKISSISKGAFHPLSTLESLSIGWNPLTASDLQTGLTGLQNGNLTFLSIKSISLGGNLPNSTFQTLQNTKLKALIMGNNRINELPPEGFKSLTQLKTIDLSNCKIQNVSDRAFAGIKSLENLQLNNNFLEAVPKNFPTTLQKLYLNENLVHELTNGEFSNLGSLRELHLDGNKIVKMFENAFEGLVSLRKLRLVGNRIGTLPKRIFSHFGRLSSLHLNKNNLKSFQRSTNITVFTPMISLQYLNLADNDCSWFPLHIFKDLRSLMHLHLENNQLGKLFMNDFDGYIFSNLQKLQSLDISNNQIHQLPGPFFRNMISLYYMNLSNNWISGWDAQLFSNAAQVKSLDLSNNIISVIHSSSLQELRSLKTLNLTNNPFACTCDLLWFREWINQTKCHVANIGKYVCNSPPDWKGRHFLTFDEKKIKCLWFDLGTVIGLSTGSAILVLIVCYAMYRKRWSLMYRCYKVKRWCGSFVKRGKNGYQTLDSEKIYNAYISCSPDDNEWVTENLLPNIDNGWKDRKPFKGSFKLYFDDRDKEPGFSKLKNILVKMEQSQNVIFVISANYEHHEEGDIEVEQAVYHCLHNSIDDIIIILVKGVIFKSIPKLLLPRISFKNFIEWDDNENAKKMFRQTLLKKLGKHN